MHYICPNCSSMKKPKIIRYFPPIEVQCLDCGYANMERDFIKEDRLHIKSLFQSH